MAFGMMSQPQMRPQMQQNQGRTASQPMNPQMNQGMARGLGPSQNGMQNMMRGDMQMGGQMGQKPPSMQIPYNGTPRTPFQQIGQQANTGYASQFPTNQKPPTSPWMQWGQGQQMPQMPWNQGVQAQSHVMPQQSMSGNGPYETWARGNQQTDYMTGRPRNMQPLQGIPQQGQSPMRDPNAVAAGMGNQAYAQMRNANPPPRPMMGSGRWTPQNQMGWSD